MALWLVNDVPDSFISRFHERNHEPLMCGIYGYIGKEEACGIIVEGLRRLEYRGYDSAGIAIHTGQEITVRKRQGRIDSGLGMLLEQSPARGNVGIGHTRWATHGDPSDENSHPHRDATGRIAVVHNGIIENFDRLRKTLLTDGHRFESATDSEVLAHLIGSHYDQNDSEEPTDVKALSTAVASALREVIGTYGVSVICSDFPDVIIGARRGSPLIIGVGNEEHFLTSDANAVIAHTKQAVFLNDYDIATVRADRFSVTNMGTGTASFQISQIEYDDQAAEKGDFEHFMLKEIFEQPQTVRNALRGRVDNEAYTAIFGGLNLTPAELRSIDRIVITACGTSWHAGLVGEYLIEELAHIPVEVEYASEFRYRNAPIDKGTLVIAITQSGETADTLAALREAKRRGHTALALCNVVGSSIAREADGGIYLHAGPEIGVASTKAFTSQVTVLTLFALFMARIRLLSAQQGTEIIKALEAVPGQIEWLLQTHKSIQKIAKKYANSDNFFFLGRHINFPVALEGALKLKEISYIHAEGYPAAEMKHGPIALIDKDTPSIVLAMQGSLYEKIISNQEVIQARKGPVIAVATQGDENIKTKAEDVIYVPHTHELIYPLLAAIPLQLLAYYIAVERGCDVDKPRNLAKSVTVE